MTASPHITVDALIASTDGFRNIGDKPKYTLLADAFRDCIVSGRFKPGDRVPAETELARMLPVSIGTIQKALSKLAATGLIVRQRKTGTFIADPTLQVNEVFIYRFRDPETGKSMMPFVRTLSVEVDHSDGPWRMALNTSRLVRVDRLVWFDQQPPAYSSVYIPFEHGAVFLELPIEDLHGLSLHRILIERFNLPTLTFEHSISCRTLSDEACSILTLPKETVGLVWDIRDFSFQDSPFLFQRYHLPPGHRAIEITESFGH